MKIAIIFLMLLCPVLSACAHASCCKKTTVITYKAKGKTHNSSYRPQSERVEGSIAVTGIEGYFDKMTSEKKEAQAKARAQAKEKAEAEKKAKAEEKARARAARSNRGGTNQRPSGTAKVL